MSLTIRNSLKPPEKGWIHQKATLVNEKIPLEPIFHMKRTISEADGS